MGRQEQEGQGLEVSKHVVSCAQSSTRAVGHRHTASCIVPQQQSELYVKKLLFYAPDSECHYVCIGLSRVQKLLGKVTPDKS